MSIRSPLASSRESRSHESCARRPDGFARSAGRIRQLRVRGGRKARHRGCVPAVRRLDDGNRRFLHADPGAASSTTKCGSTRSLSTRRTAGGRRGCTPCSSPRPGCACTCRSADSPDGNTSSRSMRGRPSRPCVAARAGGPACVVTVPEAARPDLRGRAHACPGYELARSMGPKARTPAKAGIQTAWPNRNADERAESRFSAYHRAATQGSCRRIRRRRASNSAIRTAAGLRGTDGFVAGDPRQPHYRSEQ